MRNLLIIVIYAVTLQVSFSQIIDEELQYDSLIRVNRLVTGDTNQVNVWNELAGFKVFSRPDSGIYYATNALSLSRSISFVRGELKALQLLSLSHSTLGNYSKALPAWELPYTANSKSPLPRTPPSPEPLSS